MIKEGNSGTCFHIWTTVNWIYCVLVFIFTCACPCMCLNVEVTVSWGLSHQKKSFLYRWWWEGKLLIVWSPTHVACVRAQETTVSYGTLLLPSASRSHHCFPAVSSPLQVAVSPEGLNLSANLVAGPLFFVLLFCIVLLLCLNYSLSLTTEAYLILQHNTVADWLWLTNRIQGNDGHVLKS